MKKTAASNLRWRVNLNAQNCKKDKHSFSEIQYSRTSLQWSPWGKWSHCGEVGHCWKVKLGENLSTWTKTCGHCREVTIMGRCLLVKVRLYLKTSLSTHMTPALYFKLIASFCLFLSLLHLFLCLCSSLPDLLLSDPVLGSLS